MKRSTQNYNSGNLRASSSNVDNFRNQGLKKISNNLIPDNYNYRNHNFINVKYDKYNNSNKNSYNFIPKHNKNMVKQQNINIDNMLNGLKQEIREMSKSIEKTDNELQRFIDNNNYDNSNNKYFNESTSVQRDKNINLNLSNNNRNELIKSYINININKAEELEDSFRYSNLQNDYTNNNKFTNNYKEYNKGYQYKRKNNQNNISV